MDELGEFIGGLIIAVLVIIALIYVFVCVVLPAALCYYLGKQFYNQMKKCELGSKAKLTLGIIGGVSILIAAALVSNTGINGFVIAPLSGLIFLLIAVPVLAIWVYSKKKRFLDVRYGLQSDKSDLEAQMRAKKNGIDRFQRKNDALKTKFEQTIQGKERFEKYTAELCEADPRTYTILKREWTESYSKMTDKEIEEQEKEYKRRLKQGNRTETSKKTEYAIRLCLLQIEGIKRITGRPLQTIAANAEKIQGMERERAELNKKLTKVTEEISRNESAYQAFLNSRIVLD
jgi:hypothetical protein